MDNEKRKKTIHKKTVERIGADAVEVLTPSSDAAAALPDDHGSMINNAVFEFLSYEIGGGVDSVKELSQIQFKALCMYIGRKVNKPLVTASFVLGSPVPYDLSVLESLFPVWAYFAACGGFVPFIDDFLAFCGLGADYIYSSQFKSSSARADFVQKIKGFQEMALSGKLADGRGNPTGLLAILNHAHGWTTAAADADKKTITAASVASLPDLSGDLVQIDQ